MQVCIRKRGMRCGIRRVCRYGLLKVLRGLPEADTGQLAPIERALQISLVRRRTHERACDALLVRRQRDADLARNARRHAVLQRQNVANVVFIHVRPEVDVRPGIDQLGSDPNAIA